MKNDEVMVCLWLPRDDEHKLAASLGLCEKDPALLRQLVQQAQLAVARDHPGAKVRVSRWHVWRVVRAMVRMRVENTPSGRAAAYGFLASENEQAQDPS